MGSRRLLWGLLSLGALPLFFEATTGCDVVFGLQRLKTDNAVHCDCTCTAPAARSIRIAVADDDAEEAASGNIDLGENALNLGQRLVGLRFGNLGLAQGTTIVNAFVQFRGAADGEVDLTNYTINAETSASPAAFTTTDNDLSGRAVGSSPVIWKPGTWNNNEQTPTQRTEDIGDLIQELVDLPDWNDSSAVVLLFDGSGHRSADSFDGNANFAPELIIDLGVAAVLPICAGSDAVIDSETHLTPASQAVVCSRVEVTLGGLAEACGYPTPCACSVVDVEDPSGGGRADSFHSGVCEGSCDAVVVDAPTCDNFDPNEFETCMDDTANDIEACKVHVSATNADGGVPVCVASGSALAFHAFGERSLCQVDGPADILAGGRRPISDPATAGTVELLGEPCPGGSCRVLPYFDLVMNPIEFEVRWASNPVFRDLAAAGLGLEPAVADSSTGEASFSQDTILGTGAGRRGEEGLAVDASNEDPVDVGIDWVGKRCDMFGTLSTAVGDDGVCEADGAIPCASDDDCVAVGGVCLLPPETDEMLIGLALAGPIVNQPPSAVAGAAQTIECTSTEGASFTLDGRGTRDPDQNLALTTWHAGTRTGTELARNPVVQLALGVGDAESYVLRVVDTYAQTDEDATTVAVVDTTPPELEISLSRTAIWPPNHKFVPIKVTVTTSDVCDASPTIRLVSIESNEVANGKGDGNTPVDYSGAALGEPDVEFLLRAERSGTGIDRIYTITYEAKDDSGNKTVRQASVTVAHDSN